MTNRNMCLVVAGLLLGAAACDNAKAPQWQRVSAADADPAFHVDVNNITQRAGTPYLVMQTRYSDGRYGVIRASANCARQKVEPTALNEEIFASGGQSLETRMTTLGHEDELAILGLACKGK